MGLNFVCAFRSLRPTSILHGTGSYDHLPFPLLSASDALGFGLASACCASKVRDPGVKLVDLVNSERERKLE